MNAFAGVGRSWFNLHDTRPGFACFRPFALAICLLGFLPLPGLGTDAVTRSTQPGKAAIFRDDWGVPHIYAATDEDALFGVGYAMAQDDLEAILRAFLRIKGSSADVFGEQELPLDTFNTRWQVEQKARRATEQFGAGERRRLTAYIAGIRRYVEDNPEVKPHWMPTLEAHLPVAVSHSLALLISLLQPGQGASDCVAGGVPISLAAGRAGSFGSALIASNQWVVKTVVDGQPALAVWADSHTDFNDFHAPRSEVRIHGGTLDTAGIVAAGTPYPIIATTPGVAWALTVGGPDTSDCYLVDVLVQPGDVPPKEASRGDGVPEDEQTRGAPSAYVTLNDITVPVHRGTDGQAYAMVSSYADRSGALLQQLYAMNTAADIHAFAAAVSSAGFFPQNIMAGDAQGRMYYAATGRVPRRDGTLDWRAPVRMSDPAARWSGYHPHDDLVVHVDPDVPYLWNTNTASDTVAPSGNIDARDYPAYIFNDVPGRINERGLRAQQLLARQADFDRAALLAVGFDEKLVHTPRWQAALRGALASRQPAQGAEEFARGILAFDGYTHHESSVALHYRMWRAAVDDLLVAAGLEPEEVAAAVTGDQPLPETAATALVAALEAARSRIMEKFGGTAIPAGDVIRIGTERNHWPVGGFGAGGERTLRSMQCREPLPAGDFCLVDFGQRHPILTVFGGPSESWSAVPRGQMADEESVHHDDQARLLSERRLKPTYLDWPALKPVIRNVVVLQTRQADPSPASRLHAAPTPSP